MWQQLRVMCNSRKFDYVIYTPLLQSAWLAACSRMYPISTGRAHILLSQPDSNRMYGKRLTVRSWRQLSETTMTSVDSDTGCSLHTTSNSWQSRFGAAAPRTWNEQSCPPTSSLHRHGYLQETLCCIAVAYMPSCSVRLSRLCIVSKQLKIRPYLPRKANRKLSTFRMVPLSMTLNDL